MESDEGKVPFINHPVSNVREEKNEEKGGFWKGVKEWFQVIVIALIIAIPVRIFVAEPFIVNGASMDPTFATGQFLVVDRLTYRFGEPKRGDVIVFKYPYPAETYGSDSVYYIKRIIGLPGEQVILQNGKVSIRSASSSEIIVLDEPYIDPSHVSHDTVVMPQKKPLGPTEYIVLGDNRAQSSDSRVWGPLNYQYIIGRPIVRLTPLSAISFLPGEYHENNK